MNRTVSLIATLMLGHLCMSDVHAQTAYQPALKGFQFYVGLSGSGEQMSGRRSESFNEENLLLGSPARTQTVYTNNLRMLEKNAVVSLMTGFLWKIPTLPLLIGPEIYAGRGNALSAVKDVRLDPFVGGENRLYSTDFQRKSFYGILMRVGYQFCEKYLVSLSLGIDRSQFSIERSLHYDGTVPATLIKRTPWLNGVVLGVGLERIFNQFIVGLDCRMIQYRKYNSVDNVDVAAGVTPAFLNFSVQPKITMVSLRVSYRF